MLFFSYKDFTAGPDKILEKINFGRAHHIVIYFVGKQKTLTIKELLSILQITKQSLSRVLNQLVSEKFIIVSTGKDKRTKNLSLTKKGGDLEKKLSDIQVLHLRNVLKKFNEIEINGFKKVLYGMIQDYNKKKFDEINN